MKELLVALIFISPVIIVGYRYGYGTALEQVILDIGGRLLRALLS